MKVYVIKKKLIRQYCRYYQNNTKSGIKIKIGQFLTNLWYESCTWHGPKIQLYLSRIQLNLNGRILHCVAHIVVRDRIVVAVHRNGRPQPPSSMAAAIIMREPSSATTINRPWTWIYHALGPISWATNLNRSWTWMWIFWRTFRRWGRIRPSRRSAWRSSWSYCRLRILRFSRWLSQRWCRGSWSLCRGTTTPPFSMRRCVRWQTLPLEQASTAPWPSFCACSSLPTPASVSRLYGPLETLPGRMTMMSSSFDSVKRMVEERFHCALVVLVQFVLDEEKLRWFHSSGRPIRSCTCTETNVVHITN